MQKKKNFLKIVILGDSGVGKTSILQQYLNGKVSGNSKPTIGADFSKKEILIDNTVVTLQIWDTAGQERFHSITSSYYRCAMGIMLVYDITNIRSFDNIAKWLRNIDEHANEVGFVKEVLSLLVFSSNFSPGRGEDDPG